MTVTLITQGTPILCQTEILDINGRLFDPSSIEFIYQVGGAPVTVTYTNGTAPALNTVWRTGKGKYGALVPSSSILGAFLANWTWTGSVNGSKNVEDVVVIARAGG
jgi:hypothetical protein